MALQTISAQLEEVQTAITAVMSGQSYEIAGRKMTRANLKELTDREETLLQRLQKYGDTDFSTKKTSTARANVYFS